MSKEFEVGFEGVLPATPAQAWTAITTATAAWSWPIAYEPRLGGTEKGLTHYGGTVTAWEPGRHFATRCEAPDGWFNNLDYALEERDDGTFLRFTHNGVFFENWENSYDACRQHTALYYHSLGEYLAHFRGREAVYASTDAPAASSRPGGFAKLKAALGVPGNVAVGDAVHLARGVTGTVDYCTPNFLGVRTEDALYRFFGRNAFGWPIAVGRHLFAPGANAAEEPWRDWLTEVYA
ncbi:SRPBCC domain-containing protein [Amycolatopsis minnesotensis]|uniref:Activator of Hsp90 ATPase homologue 1/2-like C-terminal domain-containing protein n=1 Tax=Amycolatopsis minnesotensis TaxID=337894 RepID=A0ABP5C4R5_9PSEU